MCTIVQYHFQYPQISEKYQLHLLTGGVLFFSNPVNKNLKCIRNIRNVFLLWKFWKNLKCIRNASEIPILPLSMPPSGPILKHILSFTHPPQLLHLILNSHISPPPTHPKTINILKCKWLPTISLNFFPPQTNS